jgi:hypothetical protein
MAKTVTPQEQEAILTREIAEKKLHRAEIDTAPIHQTEAEEQFSQNLSRKTEPGREHLSRFSRSHCWPNPTTGLLPELRTVERDGAPFLHSAGLQNVLAALFHDQILETGLAEIRQFYREYTGMTVSAAERPKLLAKINAELHKLEVERERIVSANGLPRNPDASVPAILGVEPGAPLPWDFRSQKAASLSVEAETARSTLVGIREEMDSIQGLIHRLEGDVAGFRADSIPERLAADLDMARSDLADLQDQLTTRQTLARNLGTVSARVQAYIQDHRTPRPASSDTLRNPINPAAQNAAK